MLFPIPVYDFIVVIFHPIYIWWWNTTILCFSFDFSPIVFAHKFNAMLQCCNVARFLQLCKKGKASIMKRNWSWFFEIYELKNRHWKKVHIAMGYEKVDLPVWHEERNLKELPHNTINLQSINFLIPNTRCVKKITGNFL